MIEKYEYFVEKSVFYHVARIQRCEIRGASKDPLFRYCHLPRHSTGIQVVTEAVSGVH